MNNTEEKYDSTLDTINHIRLVQKHMLKVINDLISRMCAHDDSKLKDPEKKYFDDYTISLKNTVYGSKEYGDCLAEIKPALDHHYANNSHHPEHFPNGVDDMDLADIIEMLCDWAASSKRTSDGDIIKSIDINKDRFGLSEEIVKIMKNTVRNFDLTT